MYDRRQAQKKMTKQLGQRGRGIKATVAVGQIIFEEHEPVIAAVLDVKFLPLSSVFIELSLYRPIWESIVQRPEPDITAIIHVPPSAPVRPGDSVTLQCSVVSDSENKPCPGDHSVHWFRVGSDESHPSLIYTHGNSDDECEKSPESQTPQKCVYSFSKNVSSSDAGTYYCAVATCGEILFGNGTKLNTEEFNMQDLQMMRTVLFLLCAALAMSLIVITLLIYTIKKKSGGCCNAAVVQETKDATTSGDQQNHQREENSLVYSAPTFSRKKAGKAERRNVKPAEGETIYSDVAIQS
ncbi:uncharacterized protein ABDE67_004946 [Symphorus nematophorus]